MLDDLQDEIGTYFDLKPRSDDLGLLIFKLIEFFLADEYLIELPHMVDVDELELLP